MFYKKNFKIFLKQENSKVGSWKYKNINKKNICRKYI